MSRSLEEKSSRLNPHTEAVYQQRASRGCKSLKSLQLHKENPAGSNLHYSTQRSTDDCVGDIVLGGQGEGHRRDKPFSNNLLRKTGATGQCVRCNIYRPANGRNNHTGKQSDRNWDIGIPDHQRKKTGNVSLLWTLSHPDAHSVAGQDVETLQPDDPTATGEKRNATLINAKAVNKQLWRGQREFKDNTDLCWKTQIRVQKYCILPTTEETILGE